MTPVIWGGLSSLSYGTADFVAAKTGRGIGASNALFFVLPVGILGILVAWPFVNPVVVWETGMLWLVLLHGIGLAGKLQTLYVALARGPVSMVAPIVAAHPVFVLMLFAALGIMPSTLQWIGCAVTIVGAILVAISSSSFEVTARYSHKGLQITIGLSLVCALFYTLEVVSGQIAVATYGELPTALAGRTLAWIVLGGALLAMRGRPHAPRRWWPLLAIQGMLDGAGTLFLFAGSHGADAPITAVIAGTFGAVTAILAWAFLKERIGPIQWGGIALIFVGVTMLSWPG
jgi:drug/metabolite transporter (DMT)-like permease